MRLEREQNLSFLEFNYMILQGFDFVELNKRYNCRVQIGGSDQWGNIVNGTDLGHKTGLKDPLFGLTTPLITTSSGAKMGKTASGAIWLDQDLLSPYDYYQFWRNTEDGDVIRFLKFFTDLSVSEISELAKLQGQEINEAKKVLAFEATRLCHGEAEAEKAANAARTAFEEGGTAGLPEVKLENREYKAIELFVAAGMATSNGESRRLIQGGGAKINDEKIGEDDIIKLIEGMKISSGKKKHAIVKF
jgi:tyrosyl-tRNA synthetase